ncbi:MAG TPA: hydroxymethylbilane synthase [Candidatus Binataceae bacterium]|nr:hydroxymethylbilane synthase [Candidatus Binataceae bacterium]
MTRVLRIGSRPSALAMVQAEYVRARLAVLLPGAVLEIVPIRTSGDKLSTASLAQVGGKGLFIRELEQALAERKIELAVHSMKDLPAQLPAGFRIAAVPEREDTRDLLVSAHGGDVAVLAPGARVGTSSSRRRFQALRANPKIEIVALRGNVDTRLKRIADGSLAAIIIAAAGLRRLGREADVKFAILDERDFIPAGGQGALAIETLDGDAAPEIAAALEALDDPRARYETAAERAFLAALGASCTTPVGVRAIASDETLSIRAILFSPGGDREIAAALAAPAQVNYSPPIAVGAGQELAYRMLARGAGALVGDA